MLRCLKDSPGVSVVQSTQTARAEAPHPLVRWQEDAYKTQIVAAAPRQGCTLNVLDLFSRHCIGNYTVPCKHVIEIVIF